MDSEINTRFEALQADIRAIKKMLSGREQGDNVPTDFKTIHELRELLTEELKATQEMIIEDRNETFSVKLEQLQAYIGPPANEEIAGIQRNATTKETMAGTSNETTITPFHLKEETNKLNDRITQETDYATESKKGAIRCWYDATADTLYIATED